MIWSIDGVSPSSLSVTWLQFTSSMRSSVGDVAPIAHNTVYDGSIASFSVGEHDRKSITAVECAWIVKIVPPKRRATSQSSDADEGWCHATRRPGMYSSFATGTLRTPRNKTRRVGGNRLNNVSTRMMIGANIRIEAFSAVRSSGVGPGANSRRDTRHTWFMTA